MSNENKIKVERSTHNRQAIIKLLFGYDTELIARVKQLPNARWSQTMRCWYVPDIPQSVEAYTECLRIFFHYHAGKDILEIDNEDLHTFNTPM